MNMPLLKEKVAGLYRSMGHLADPWVEWGYPNHVIVVAKKASDLAERFNANPDLCEAAALLHDCADAVMHRSDPRHESESRTIAERLMQECDFQPNEINTILDDIIAPHSCSTIQPVTLEAKVLATADALAHLQTDFYLYFAWRHFGGTSDDLDFLQFKEWVSKRLEKDFHTKIQFSEIREELKPRYEALKNIFSNYLL